MQNNARSGNEASPIAPREPQIALLISICPGLGQVYAGHLTRGVISYLALIIVSWLAAIAFMYVENRFAGILLLSVPFAGVVLIALDAFRCAKEQPQDYRLAWFNSAKAYAGIFLLLLVTANPLMDFFVGKNVVRAFYVTSDSMEPTILGNDILVINKLASPEKGDIVLINLERKARQQSTQLTSIMADQVVSRIIAGPGDTLEIRGKDVLVNGEKQVESYAYYSNEISTINMGEEASKFGPRQIPADTYFALGDNRNFAIDSRVLGFIGKNRISGKATKVFWSWNLAQNTIQWDRTAKALK
ncbi:MAG: signal peptidase I [Sulfuricella sp.]|jgi:signal peptidase I